MTAKESIDMADDTDILDAVRRDALTEWLNAGEFGLPESEFYDRCNRIEEVAGSVMESAFGIALLACYAFGAENERFEQQVEIGPYRADFVLYWVDPDQTGRVASQPARLVVEIDGHDWHDRTKEQARRDRRRDREMLAQGYFVCRFTGSEVYAEPLECAREAYDLASTLYYAKIVGVPDL